VQYSFFENSDFDSCNQGIGKMITERDGQITAFEEGKRAGAELTRLNSLGDLDGIDENSFWEGNWFFFKSLVNQSGEKGLGSSLLDEVLEYCRQKKYSILHTVRAYGGYGQKETEDWFISKGFKPLNFAKYKNMVLIWRPQE
jgi:hypothetical protein